MKRKKAIIISAAVVLAVCSSAIPAFASSHRTHAGAASGAVQGTGNHGVCQSSEEQECEGQCQYTDRHDDSHTGHQSLHGHENGHHSERRSHDRSCTIQ